MYTNRSTAKTLRNYRAKLRTKHHDSQTDIWCGEVMQSNCMKCLFEGTDDNECAIVLQFILDDVQMHKLRFNDVWPLIYLNLNLSPSERFQEDNVLPLAITPELKEPVNLDSFISPMVDEVLHLSQNGV